MDTRAARSKDGGKNSVSGRLGFAGFATRSAQVDVTGAQKEQYQIVKKAYDGQEAVLNNLLKNKIPSLEREFEQAGGVLYINTSRRRFEETKKE